MPWVKGERIPTNLIVGFLGSGKTTAIAKLILQRSEGEHWSVFVNEFGQVSIDHALVGACTEGVAVEQMGGGCACCTMSFAFKPLLAQFIRRSKPDRLILEPSGVSHPAKVVDLLRSDDFSGAIDLRNIICLIDPKDLEDPKWQQSEVFQDQVQLADIVVINWADSRTRQQVDRCRQWVESFNPPKQMVVETAFGEIDAELLDRKFDAVRFPLFAQAHPIPSSQVAGQSELLVLDGADEVGANEVGLDEVGAEHTHAEVTPVGSSVPGNPLRFPSQGPGYEACGWVFHVDDVFDRKSLMEFLSDVEPIVRLKGVFRCQGDWWAINRAKDATDVSASTYRRDSRLEVILVRESLDWDQLEQGLRDCIVK